MEPWTDDIIKSIDKKVKIIDVSSGIELIMKKDKEHEEEPDRQGLEGEYNSLDPHIWLDFDNAKTMAENIAKAFIEVDPENTDYYQNNLRIYQEKLTELDKKYRNVLFKCETKTIIYGGHYAFGYMAKRYGLQYVSIQGFSPDAEPTTKEMIALVDQIRKNNINYIFYEELTSPKIAETLANETKTKLLLLNGAHNISKKDYEMGISFISIMEENLKNLSLGLGCQEK